MSTKLGNKLDSWTRELLTEGRYVFTSKEAILALKKSPIAVRASLRRLKAKGLIASPVRGFNVIIPPEYQRLGCLPPEQFIPDLMGFLGKPYYAGLLTAAQFHGAAHQQPQEFQVVTSQNRKRIMCGKVNIHFVAKSFAKDIPTISIKTPRGYLSISTLEMTAFDLMLYPHYAGGLSNVATILVELLEKMHPQKLVQAAKLVPDISTIQRLGFLLDKVLKKKNFALTLLSIVKRNARAFIPLVPSLPKKGALVDKRWKVFINMKIEPEL